MSAATTSTPTSSVADVLAQPHPNLAAAKELASAKASSITTQRQVPPQKQQALPIWLSMMTSCAAGCGAWLFAHPFEVLKNHIVLSPHDTPLMVSIRRAAKDPYKGLSGGISRQLVYASCRLGFYPPIKNLIVDPSVEPNMAQRAAAGAASGAAAAFLSSPVEVCLVMMTKSVAPLSIPSAARQIYGESGIKGFWRGVGPLTNRAAVVGVCQVAMYDQSRSWFTKYSNKKVAAAGGDKSAGWSNNKIVVSASTFTGFFYSFITMPLELARVKLSCYKKPTPDAKVPGMFGILAHAARHEGVASIFKSFFPYFGRCTAHTIVCFFLLEQINARAKLAYFGSN